MRIPGFLPAFSEETPAGAASNLCTGSAVSKSGSLLALRPYAAFLRGLCGKSISCFRRNPEAGAAASSAPAVQSQNLDRCKLCDLMPLFFAAFAESLAYFAVKSFTAKLA